MASNNAENVSIWWRHHSQTAPKLPSTTWSDMLFHCQSVWRQNSSGFLLNSESHSWFDFQLSESHIVSYLKCTSLVCPVFGLDRTMSLFMWKWWKPYEWINTISKHIFACLSSDFATGDVCATCPGIVLGMVGPGNERRYFVPNVSSSLISGSEKKYNQFDNFVVSDGTVSCRNDNLRCHKWHQSCQIGDILFSVWVHTQNDACMPRPLPFWSVLKKYIYIASQ